MLLVNLLAALDFANVLKKFLKNVWKIKKNVKRRKNETKIKKRKNVFTSTKCVTNERVS